MRTGIMACLRKYTKADGATIYKAEIAVKKDGIVIRRERTFDKQKLARDWGMRREVELQDSSVYSRRDRLPVGGVIERYIKEFSFAGWAEA
jgi:hypothetical protein